MCHERDRLNLSNEPIIQMKHNIAKQWAILQAWPRIWTQDYREQIQLAVGAGLELEVAIN